MKDWTHYGGAWIETATKQPQTKERRNTMSRIQELRDMVNTFERDFIKFYDKGNKSAGTRVRKHMAQLKRKAQEIRAEVTQIKLEAKEGKEAATTT